ncbi:BZ3500_MvSof-1268-A1-R1_Chr1-1g00954 [Microbotryum saponariae]|uniref:BZ3500_MvSof-1268-A1-R1_Chr1-1g00954 protein n=1 Tax=Microbotryum saponariae TaxID=289078 RepID=A0A2X0L2T6_9BASI|nr:BZ3500_MvSof-1268-A1-R1_Chr1-1g00954 [Microbotryum saponariae]SCZ93021.1 BZ3501_MvSof-1269-A2-R1_Chr1-1g00551 [Microbotryum saponariae]
MIHRPARSLPPDSSPPVASTSRLPESLSPDGQLDGDAGDELLDDDYDDGAESASGMVRGAEEDVDELETFGGEGAVQRATKKSTSATSQKTQAAFIHKLYSMASLGRSNFDSLIDWTKDGKAFGVSRPNEFAKVVLPQYFKHSNFASFVRQCNMYGFHKVNDLLPNISQTPTTMDVSLAWEFQHPFFRRDEPELLSRIKRKSVRPSALSGAQPTVTRSSVASSSVVTCGSRAVFHTPQDAKEQFDVHVPAGRDDGDRPPCGNESSINQSQEAGAKWKKEAQLHQCKLSVGEPHAISRREESPQGPIPDLRRPNSGSCVSSNRSPAPSFLWATLPPTNQPSRPPFPTPSHSPRPVTAGSADSSPIAKQVASLEARVQILTTALADSNALASSTWSNAHTSMRLFLGVLEGFDLTRDQRNQLERCSSLLYGGEVDPSVVLPALAHSPSPPPWAPNWQTASTYAPRAPCAPSSSSTPVTYGQHRPPANERHSRTTSLRRPTGSDPFPRPESDIPPSYVRSTPAISSCGSPYDAVSSAPPGITALTHPPTYRPAINSANTSFPGAPLPPSRPAYPVPTGQMRSAETLPSLASLLAGASPTAGVGRSRSLAAGHGDDRGDETKKRRV